MTNILEKKTEKIVEHIFFFILKKNIRNIYKNFIAHFQLVSFGKLKNALNSNS
jgi:hypothetical protein